MDAPQESFYTREGADLLPDVRDLLALHRERAMSPSELAARLQQQDEYAVLAALEALALDGEIAA